MRHRRSVQSAGDSETLKSVEGGFGYQVFEICWNGTFCQGFVSSHVEGFAWTISKVEKE